MTLLCVVFSGEGAGQSRGEELLSNSRRYKSVKHTEIHLKSSK